MNLPYARSRFKTKLAPGDTAMGVSRETAREMREQTSMMCAGNDNDQRRYRKVPRVFKHTLEGKPIDAISLARFARRQHRNMQHKGVGQTPLFSEALQRATPKGLMRGMAESIRRYSAGLFFSKATRIRAGRR